MATNVFAARSRVFANLATKTLSSVYIVRVISHLPRAMLRKHEPIEVVLWTMHGRRDKHGERDEGGSGGV